MLVSKKFARKVLVSGVMIAGMSGAYAADNSPTVEELWELVQSQQLQLEQLKQALEQTQSRTTEVKVQSQVNSERLEAVGEVLDQDGGLAGASWADRTTVGSYGEVIYNGETTGSDTKELDVQRFVIFLDHEFNDNLRFVSELEIEHSLISDDARAPGTVELEQAYLEWDYTANHSVLAGMHLVPMGIVNETHEPNAFYGVERNRTESRIIPSTYRVNGIKFAGQFSSGLSYDLGIHEGLFFESGNGGELNIRDARQSGARAEMDSPAYTGRLRYTAIPGLELGVAFQYQTDMTQAASTRGNIGRDGVIDGFGNSVDDLDGLLSETHLVYQRGDFGFKALYAQWNINSRIEQVANNDLSNNGLGRDKQLGFYLEPSYKINDQLGVFARYEETDERAGSNLAGAKDSTTKRYLMGLNYWLTDDVVLKADYQFEDDDIDRDLNGFNLGIGWQF